MQTSVAQCVVKLRGWGTRCAHELERRGTGVSSRSSMATTELGSHGDDGARLPWRPLLEVELEGENQGDRGACSPRSQWTRRRSWGSWDGGEFNGESLWVRQGLGGDSGIYGGSGILIFCMETKST